MELKHLDENYFAKLLALEYFDEGGCSLLLPLELANDNCSVDSGDASKILLLMMVMKISFLHQ